MVHTPKFPAVWIRRDGGYLLEAAYFASHGGKPHLVGQATGDYDRWKGTFDDDSSTTLDLKAEVARRFVGKSPVVESAVLGGGDFHRRMWRKGGPALDETGDERAFLTSCSAALGLMDHMRTAFRFIEPVPENAAAFGHELRELLMLACTEVETAWRGILEINGYVNPKKPDDRWSTSDYVRLLAPMQLADFSVKLTLHPGWPELRPFGSWDPNAATSSLRWYDAYNKTKHDREDNFKHATLSSVIEAMAGVYVMIVAQFGVDSFGPINARVTTHEFTLTHKPKYLTRDAVYIPARQDLGITWNPVPFFTL